MKKTIVIVMTIILSAAFILSGCKGGGEGVYIAKDGSTDYTIVVPEVKSSAVASAADELVLFFERATGARLPVISDSEVLLSKSSRYISIGNTNLFKQSGLTPEAELGLSGTRIKSVNNNYFLYGKEDTGALYAVYDLLTLLFDFEYFGMECYRLNKNSAPRFLQLDYKNIPSIQSRAMAYAPMANDPTELNRFRQVHFYSGFFIAPNGIPFHNDIQYVTDELSGHEDYWLATKDGAKLFNHMCYTAHGNEVEYNLMLDAMFRKLKHEIIINPEKLVACISTEDSRDVCNCAACTEISEAHGSCYSAVSLRLCNALIKRVYEWFETEEGAEHKRDFKLCIMVYRGTENAPAEFNEVTGKYEAIGDLEIDKNAGIFLAIYGAAYPYPLTDSINSSSYRNLLAWSQMTDNFYLWMYNTNFQSWYAPFDVFNDLQDYYRIAANAGTKHIINEGNHYAKDGSSAWTALKVYLNAKLQWNCEADTEALIKDFFANYYMDAAPYVEKVFSSFRLHSAHLKTESGSNYGGAYSHDMPLYFARYWPKDLMLDWNDFFQQGIDAVEKYRNTDPELHATLYKRIGIEKMSPIFLLLHLYGRELNTDDFTAYGKEFKEYAGLWNFSIGDLNTPIQTLYDNLGI